MIKNNVCVYHFLDNNNMPFYVGKTNNFHRRKTEHLCVLKKGKKGKTWPVYNKIRKLIREENYELNMKIIDQNLSNDEANNLEIKYIKEYRENGYKLYNLTDGGEGASGILRKKWTLEQRQKLSNSKKGKYTKKDNPFYGKHHSEETKEKISAIHKGKKTGKDNPFYGKKHTPESIKIISETAKKTFTGVSKTEDHKQKISKSHLGIKQSEASNEKNRIKNSLHYKVKIFDSDDEFIWIRGCVELSKHLLKKYNIKITAANLTSSAKKQRSCKKLLIVRIDTIN